MAELKVAARVLLEEDPSLTAARNTFRIQEAQDLLDESLRQSNIGTKTYLDHIVARCRLDTDYITTLQTPRTITSSAGCIRGLRNTNLALRLECGLGLLQTFKAETFQGCLLGVSYSGLDLAFAIWILDATRHGDRTVVRQDVAIKRIEGGIVSQVGWEHAHCGARQLARRCARP
jgi:hypothetical protein